MEQRFDFLILVRDFQMHILALIFRQISAAILIGLYMHSQFFFLFIHFKFFAAILTWDVYHRAKVVEDFAVCALLIHFVYFQLPLKSAALAFLHPPSFCASIVVLANYWCAACCCMCMS